MPCVTTSRRNSTDWPVISTASSASAVLQVEKLKQKAEATLHVAGREVVGNAEHEDMYAAVDLLVDKLDRQLIKHKEKQLDHTQGAVTR